MLAEDVTSLRPSLIDCFPHPAASRNSGGSAGPTPQTILNEWRRLYSLISLCCVAERTHLLVAADVPSQLTLTFLQPMLPRGPKYFELRLTSATTREEVSDFILRADLANISSAFGCPLPPTPTAVSAISARSHQGHRRQLSAASSDEGKEPAESVGAEAALMNQTVTLRQASSLATGALGGAGSSGGHHQRRVVVVLQNLELASRAVHSAVMDVVAHGQSRTPSGARRVGSVRIVAFCRTNAYAAVPSFLRCAFCMSTFVSAEASGRSVDLQGIDSSTIVNRSAMQDLCQADENAMSLLDTAYLSPFTERFMYDVVVSMRGSIIPNTSTAASVVARVPHFLVLLRLAALLFSASDDRQDEVTDGVGRVVVTPTEVACLAPHFVAHLLQVCKKEASAFLRLASDRNAALGPRGIVVTQAVPAWPMWDALVVAQRRTGSAVSPHRRRQSGSIFHSNMAFVATGAFPSPVQDSAEDLERNGSSCPFIPFTDAFSLVGDVLRTSCPPPG